ncbi:hypothetical protein BDV06DRAFT_218294 [Aspergillus oleicola]
MSKCLLRSIKRFQILVSEKSSFLLNHPTESTLSYILHAPNLILLPTMDTAYQDPTLNEAYVFRAPQYARIKVIPNKPIDTIKLGPISDNQPSLTKVGLTNTKLDAVIPDNPSEIWVFSGSQFARVKSDPSPANEDKVIWHCPLRSALAFPCKGWFRED